MPKKNQGRAANPRPKNKRPTKTKAKPAAIEQQSSYAPLPNVLTISLNSWKIIWQHKKTFSLIVLIYGIAYLILVLGLSSPTNLNSAFHGHLSSLYSGFNAFTYLVGSTTSSSTASGSAYQVFIVIVASLSIIWALRQFYQGVNIRARDSYYKGMYPFVQYIIVLLFIALELIPLAVAIGLYAILITGGISTTILEKSISILISVGLASFSLYLISSSTMALYIATLPDMTPLKALRSAKSLVKNRRFSVLRKIIFLPFLLFIIAGIITLPFILIVPSVSVWLFFILTLIALVYIHSYLYNLYRGLINDKSSS